MAKEKRAGQNNSEKSHKKSGAVGIVSTPIIVRTEEDDVKSHRYCQLPLSLTTLAANR